MDKIYAHKHDWLAAVQKIESENGFVYILECNTDHPAD